MVTVPIIRVVTSIQTQFVITRLRMQRSAMNRWSAAWARIFKTSVHSLLNNAISALPDGHSTRVEPAAWPKCVENADGSAMKFTWVPTLDRFAQVLHPTRISEAESLHWPGA